MAKVATGQKMDRLPPGKIFGMAVTEPNPTQLPVATESSATIEHTGEPSSGSPDRDESKNDDAASEPSANRSPARSLPVRLLYKQEKKIHNANYFKLYRNCVNFFHLDQTASGFFKPFD